jgi:hypothetical protein
VVTSKAQGHEAKGDRTVRVWDIAIGQMEYMLGDTAGHLSGHSHRSEDHHSELQQTTLYIVYENRDNIRWRDTVRSDKSEYIAVDVSSSLKNLVTHF